MLGPVISHSPLSNTENLSGPYAVNCNIMPSGSGIDPSKTKLLWSRNNPLITDSVLMTNSGGNNWTASIPGNGSTATYRYYIKTTDSSGRTSVSPAGAIASLHTFVAEQDNQNPVISHLALSDQAKPNWPVTVAATVTDNLGIDSAWVRWYKNFPGTGIKHFKLNNSGGSSYSALFNSLNSDVNIGDKIFYKIFASDNSLSHNSDSTSLYSFNITDVKLCEEFSSGTFPPGGWNVEYTGTNYWSLNSVSSYGAGTGSAKFDFWNAASGTIQSLVTLAFSPSLASDTLKFDHAYAPYTTGTDSLSIETSTNGGSTYSVLIRLHGNASGGALNTTTTSTTAFTPSSAQWATKKYALPVGTNKVKFRARSGFGNNLYVDGICVVNNASAALSNISFIQEGYFNSGSSFLNQRDTVKLYLRNSNAPYFMIDSCTALLDSLTFTATGTFSNAVSGMYYVQVKHRNSLETWSKSGGENYTRGIVFNYNFTTLQSQAFGNNMTLKNSKYCIYSGDTNSDGIIDASDNGEIDNDAAEFTTGYAITDITGDGITDASDLAIAGNNAANFVNVISP